MVFNNMLEAFVNVAENMSWIAGISTAFVLGAYIIAKIRDKILLGDKHDRSN